MSVGVVLFFIANRKLDVVTLIAYNRVAVVRRKPRGVPKSNKRPVKSRPPVCDGGW